MAAVSQQASELPQAVVVVVESQQAAVVAKPFVVVGFVLQQAARSHFEFLEASVGQKSVVDK